MEIRTCMKLSGNTVWITWWVTVLFQIFFHFFFLFCTFILHLIKGFFLLFRSCRWRMPITSPTTWQRTSPPTLTGKGKTTVMETTLRCKLWQRCTIDQWRCTSMAQVGPPRPNPLPPVPIPPPFSLAQVSTLNWSGCFLSTTEPINTFHSIHQNNDEPIRVSYHRNIHYNSVVNPNKATIGVGLGLPAFKPGVRCMCRC